MKITVEYNHHLLKKAINKQREEIGFEKDFTVGKLISLLNERYKLRDLIIDDKTENLRAMILINGVNTNDLLYKFQDNDKINILALVTGG